MDHAVATSPESEDAAIWVVYGKPLPASTMHGVWPSNGSSARTGDGRFNDPFVQLLKSHARVDVALYRSSEFAAKLLPGCILIVLCIIDARTNSRQDMIFMCN